MEYNLAIALMKELDKLDTIFREIHRLADQMSVDEGKRIRQVVGSFIADIYTEVEMDIEKQFPSLGRDKDV